MTVLRAPPGSPWWLVAAADTILVLHIAGGSVGILAGMVALFTRKGSRVHRLAGKLFAVAMLVMATIGAAASPFLPVPEMANVVAGILAIYLVVTGWMAVQRKPAIERWEKRGLAVALGIVAAGALFMWMAKNSPTGTVGKTPPQAFIVFVVVGAFGALGDLHLILRGTLSRVSRVARHLWRMTAALTLASGSFFLGQQKVMPLAMRGSPWLFVPVFVPLLLLFVWLVRVRIGKRFKGGVAARKSPDPHLSLETP